MDGVTLPSAFAELERWAETWCLPGETERWNSDEFPQKATVLSAVQVAERGGETEFASSYAAYDALCEEEKERFGLLRVVHSLEASQRRVTPNPSAEQLRRWRSRPTHEHPLVWTHKTGRKSLVLGASADYIAGVGLDEGPRAARRAARPGDRSRQGL
jgi:alpha-ketoglutarate-dependent taurine dioxygenase